MGPHSWTSWFDHFIAYSHQVLPLTLFFSIPENIVAVMFSLFLWGQPLRKHWRRILLFAAVEALYADYSVFLLPANHFFIYSLLLSQALFVLFFRRLAGWRSALVMGCTMFAIGLLGENGSALISSLFMTRSSWLHRPIVLILTNLYWLAGLPLLTVWLSRRNIRPGKDMLELIRYRRQQGSPLFYLLSFLFLQILCASTLELFAVQHVLSRHPGIMSLLLLVMLALSLVLIFTAMRVMAQTRNEAIQSTQDVYLENMNKMFTALRGQRHDYLNHVQVIHSMVQMKKYDRLLAYTRELVEESQTLDRAIQVGDPALAALIQAKSITAVSRKIRFHHECENFSDISLGVKSIDIVKILGNLIDNAFDATAILPPEERWVHLKSRMDGERLYFSVSNSGETLEEEKASRIFQAGFTTKSEGRHSGMGLTVVRDRVEFYRGTINVTSAGGTTEFTVELPLKGAAVIRTEAGGDAMETVQAISEQMLAASWNRKG